MQPLLTATRARELPLRATPLTPSLVSFAAVPLQVVAVYGIPIEDPETAALTRKVLQISGLMAIFRILAVIFSFSYYGGTYVYAPLSGIAFSLLIPACGYYGARDRRRDLLQWFVGCNIVSRDRAVPLMRGRCPLLTPGVRCDSSP